MRQVLIMKKMLLSALMVATGLSAFTQNNQQTAPLNPEPCGVLKQKMKMFEMNPGLRAQDSLNQLQFQAFYEDYMRNHFDPTRTGAERDTMSYVIPVVFHIVHLGGPENISNEQVYDAIRVMNEDYSKTNSDTNIVVNPFKPYIGFPDIEFRLAQKDPNGNCHPGITRTYSSHTYDGGWGWTGHPIVDAVAAAHGTWPQKSYLNIFVCIDPDGAAGYTVTPGTVSNGNSMYGGIIVRHDYVGAIGTSSPGRARTLTHEAGHWLNLSHPWGGNNNPGNASSCGTDDGVTDTPLTIGWTTCTLNGNSCDDTNGSLPPSSWTYDVIDNVQNYMDYSYCSRMFTHGQAARMQAALNSGASDRDQLSTTSNLIATGVVGPDILCEADFDADSYVICAGQSINFTDMTYHGATQWDWNFTGATPAISTDQNPNNITYNTPGTYTVSLSAGNGTATVSETKTAFITVLANDELNQPLVEGFESATSLPNNEWFLDNADNGTTFQVTTNGASSGSKSIYLNNSSSNAGNVDAIISNTFDLSNNSTVIITFDYAFAQRTSSDNDNLKVSVSKDCGQTWSVRKSLSGSNLATAPVTGANYVPSPSHWETVTINNVISSYLVPGFRVKFEFESDGGNNLWIDNINISDVNGLVGIDGSAFNLNVYPNPTGGLTNIEFNVEGNEEVQAEIVDITGRTVSVLLNENTTGMQNLSWDTSNISEGIYLLKVKVGNAYFVHKITVKH